MELKEKPRLPALPLLYESEARRDPYPPNGIDRIGGLALKPADPDFAWRIGIRLAGNEAVPFESGASYRAGWLGYATESGAAIVAEDDAWSNDRECKRSVLFDLLRNRRRIAIFRSKPETTEAWLDTLAAASHERFTELWCFRANGVERLGPEATI